MTDPRIGKRVELHPGTDLWMRGARYGTVVRVKGDLLSIRMDHPQVRKLVKLPVDRVTFIDYAVNPAYVRNPVSALWTLLLGGVAALGAWFLLRDTSTPATTTPLLPGAKTCGIDAARLNAFATSKGLLGVYMPNWYGYETTGPAIIPRTKPYTPKPGEYFELTPPMWAEYIKIVPSDNKATDGSPTWTPPLVVLSDGTFWTYDVSGSPPFPVKHDELRAEYCGLFASAPPPNVPGAPAEQPPKYVAGLGAAETWYFVLRCFVYDGSTWQIYDQKTRTGEYDKQTFQTPLFKNVAQKPAPYFYADLWAWSPTTGWKKIMCEVNWPAAGDCQNMAGFTGTTIADVSGQPASPFAWL